MFHEAAEYVKSELVKLGLQDAAIEQFPADGKTRYWTYISPVGWTVRSAELRIIEPEEELLCTYEDCPQCLHTFSNGTPPEGVVAELVDVGKGTSSRDYEGKDVEGRFVLATGRAKLVHEQAVHKHGAVGVITDSITHEMPNVRESLDIPDAHAYQAIWPTAEQLPDVKLGFSLSKRQGGRLRAWLEDGKTVKLRARADAKLFPFYEDVITATMQGAQKPDEEIFLVAHLCHPKPSANDNASGSGLLLEIARTIKTLIAIGKIPSPARTIRFIWVPETLGTVAYISNHPDLAQRLVAGIDLDMVGQNQELCRSSLNLDRTPDSCPSYLNDYVYGLMEQMVEEFDHPTTFGSSSTFRYRSNPFSGGSDHAEFTEPTTHVPCVMLVQWPDLYYHTSMDTMDKVSEESLKRVGWIAAVAALTLANADAREAFQFAHQTTSKGMTHVAEAATEAVRDFVKKQEPEGLMKTASFYMNKIQHIVWREQEAVKSVTRLAENTELTSFIKRCREDIADTGERETQKLAEALSYLARASRITLPAVLQETEVEKELMKLVPKRLFRGTLSADLLRQLLGEEEYEWYELIVEKDMDFKKKMLEIINFMDGRRTAHDITNAVSAEYNPTDPQHVLKFLRDLQKTKLVTFQ